jgi:uncharacterized protein
MNNNIINRIIDLTSPEKIILFGSQAKGTVAANSDIDLLILIEGVINKRKTAQQLYKDLLPLKGAVDLIIDTPENYNKYKKEKSFIYYQIEKTGKVVCEKHGKRIDMA